MKAPMIEGPGGTAFHDSSLLDVRLGPQLDEVEVVVCTQEGQVWSISFKGVLRLEYENNSWGPDSYPAEVYAIYIDDESEETRRWKSRLTALGAPPEAAAAVQHVVLASSHYRGWGAREHLAGVNIVCQGHEIAPAPKGYQRLVYRRPVIEAGDD